MDSAETSMFKMHEMLIKVCKIAALRGTAALCLVVFLELQTDCAPLCVMVVEETT
jgi:hypothetical protein